MPGSQLFLVPAGYYTVHSLEELPGFAGWVGRHFSATSELAFAVFAILTLSLVVVAGHRAARQEAHGGWVVLAVAAQVQFGLNALVHLATAALSPSTRRARPSRLPPSACSSSDGHPPGRRLHGSPTPPGTSAPSRHHPDG